jgi:DNA (cytosine-5)-methyltransferase 1
MKPNLAVVPSLIESPQRVIGKPLTFIDLFAGIGGFHLAFNAAGALCVMACEIDPHARSTYVANHSVPFFPEDITQVPSRDIPDFDVLCAGFPCQPFSQAGFKRGFADLRGTLFFDIARILDEKRPQAFFLENVQHLKKHDDGRTFAAIQHTLKALGYSFYCTVVRASDYGLPQHRPRLFMVGFRDPSIVFVPPPKQPLRLTMSDVFGAPCSRTVGYTLRVGGKGSGLTDRRNWDCYLVNNQPQRLSIKEAKAMQGFPESFVFPVSNTQALKQLGNSVAVPAVQAFANSMLHALVLSNQGKQIAL